MLDGTNAPSIDCFAGPGLLLFQRGVVHTSADPQQWLRVEGSKEIRIF